MVRQRHHLTPSRDIDDQRILESDWPKAKEFHRVSLDHDGSLACYLSLINNSMQII